MTESAGAPLIPRTRAQAIVCCEGRILMAKHQDWRTGRWHWCLPGGGVEPGETARAAALRELQEECHVAGSIVRKTCHAWYPDGSESVTFHVDIGDQTPRLGFDPEFLGGEPALVGLAWLRLDEMPERDRAFVWAAGLLGVPGFLDEVVGWGDATSYPRR